MEIEAILKLLGGLVALVAALGTVLKIFDVKSANQKMANVGTQFASVVEALASDNKVRRHSGAILLRRFFNPDTEAGAAGVPFAPEAVMVIASLLREEQTGVFQKLLADGLTFAPRHEELGVAYVNLVSEDFQGVNLSGAYLGDRDGERPAMDVSGCDFFQADLSGASLNGAKAIKAVFYEAMMKGTRLEKACLREANFGHAHLELARFTGSDLAGADFNGAVLSGARFADAKNLPEAIVASLDQNGIYRGE